MISVAGGRGVGVSRLLFSIGGSEKLECLSKEGDSSIDY